MSIDFSCSPLNYSLIFLFALYPFSFFWFGYIFNIVTLATNSDSIYFSVIFGSPQSQAKTPIENRNIVICRMFFIIGYTYWICTVVYFCTIALRQQIFSSFECSIGYVRICFSSILYML